MPSEVEQIYGKQAIHASCVSDCLREENSADLSAGKYQNLFSNATYDPNDLNSME